MTNKIQLIAILALTTILITGGFGLTQLAYSTGYTQNDDNKKQNEDNKKQNDDNKKQNGDNKKQNDDNKKQNGDNKKQNDDIKKQNDDNKKQNDDNKKQNDDNKKQNEENMKQHEENMKQHEEDCDDENDDEHDDENDDEHDDENDDEHDDDCTPEGEPPIVDPPTITIVNNVASDPQPFDITVSQTVGVPVLEVINPTTTKYTVDSHTKVTISGSEDRPILITGDGNCPENNGGFVNIENGQDITCIYSDRPVVQTGSGVIFHFDTLQFKIADETSDGGTMPLGLCTQGSLPCINFYTPTSSLIIVPNIGPNDPQQLTNTSLVLVNVNDLTIPGGFAGCVVNGIALEDSTGKLGFIIKCSDLQGDIEKHTFNANFAIIETA